MISAEECKAREAAHAELVARGLVSALEEHTAFVSGTLRDLGATEETLHLYQLKPEPCPPEPPPDPMTGWPATHKITERIGIWHRGKLLGHVNTLSSTPYADEFSINVAFKAVSEGQG